MIISTHTGKIIHHDDCTYCVLRHKKAIGTKTRKREQERCLLKADLVPGDRLCDAYTQVNCECDECKERFQRFDVETLLDKKDKLW